MVTATLTRPAPHARATNTAHRQQKVLITESCGMPDVASAIRNFMDGRYSPYGHGWEREVGSELSMQMQALGITLRDAIIATGRSGRQLGVIMGGLYDREKLDPGEIGRIANISDVSMKTLRRIGDEADGVKPKFRDRESDPGYLAMYRMARKDAASHPETYRESMRVGAGVRFVRERIWVTKRWLAQKSCTPIEFITLLEHGLVPQRLMDSADLANLLDTLRADRRGIAIVGAALISSNK